jgi:lysophospholipase L1-like esterase
VGWIALTFVPSWRGLLIDVGRLALARLPFIVLLVASAIVLLLGLPRSSWSLWAGVGGSLALLAVAAARVAFQRDRRHFYFSLVLLCANLLILVLLDLAVGAYVLPQRSHNNILVEHDPLLGWKLRRGISVTRETSFYVAKETINRHGFRTAEVGFEKPPGTKRIVVLGDSFTEAQEVNDGETYPEVLQELLSGSRPVEVISLGVAGYSTDQELLAYLDHGRRYAPDLVVLQFCVNDLHFNIRDGYWRGKKPRFLRHGDVLMLSGIPVPNVRNTGLFSPELLQRSSLVLLIESVLRQLAVSKDLEDESDLEEAWRVTELLLRDLERIVASDGAQLVVFYANRSPRIEPRLRGVLETLSIPYLDTSDAFVGDPSSYRALDHWNQKGHRAIAEALAGPLALLLDAEPTASAAPAPRGRSD